MLGCSADTTEPCLGFTADCADLASVFAGIEVPGAEGIAVDYICRAFPEDDNARDSLILGLISYACSLPVSVFLYNVFWNANTADYDAAWLRWNLPRRVLLGKIEWRFRTGDELQPAVRRAFATIWCVNFWYNLQQWLAERPTAWLFARQQRKRARRGEPVIDVASHEGVAMHTEIKLRMFSVAGVAFTYVIWAVMACAYPIRDCLPACHC